MGMGQGAWTAGVGAVCLWVCSGAASAAVVFQQGFEANTDGWVTPASYGSIARVASGTGGVSSSDGSFHALITGTPGSSAPFTRWGGYSPSWVGGYATSLDVYLDTSWVAGSGFDFSSAVNNQAGTHRRDFIFHVAKDSSTGKLLVGGSNNSNFATREDLENIPSYEVTNSGWYTLQHVFRDAGGVLAVDLNLLDDMGTVLFTTTRSDASDVIATQIGGNRYGWFTFNNVAGGVAIDSAALSTAEVPLPGTLALAGLALFAAGVARRRR